MHPECLILIPEFDNFHSEHDKHGCINKNAHFDGHINVLSNGWIIQWDHDFSCRSCNPEECECFTYKYISKQRALDILTKNYNSSIPHEVLQIIESLKEL